MVLAMGKGRKTEFWMFGFSKGLSANPDFIGCCLKCKRRANRYGTHGNGHDRVLPYEKKSLFRTA